MNAVLVMFTKLAGLFGALLLAFPVLATAHQASARELVAPLSNRLGVLIERAAFAGSPDLQLLEETQDAVLDLQGKLEKSSLPLPEEYYEAIEGFTKALPSPDSIATLTTESKDRLLDLRRDLLLKSRYLASGMGATAFSKSLRVVVEVRTRKQGRPVDGYEVFARPVAFPSEWRATPFGSPTNDARRELAPGIYTFIFRRGTEETQRPVEIGEEGLPAQTVWQEIP